MDSAAVTAGSLLYETDSSVNMYIDFHFGPEALGVPNFPRVCAEICLANAAEDRRERCLDMGCSVGRSSFELARGFRHVDAIDFSARFIRSAVGLQSKATIQYEVPVEGELTIARTTSLLALGLEETADRVLFAQGDACNMKAQFTNYDLVFAGNLIDRLYAPAEFLALIRTKIRPGGLLVLTSPYTWLSDYTPKEKWLGGRMEAGKALSTFDSLRAHLEGSAASDFQFVARQDVPFVIRETARKHQYTIAELTVWRLNA